MTVELTFSSGRILVPLLGFDAKARDCGVRDRGSLLVGYGGEKSEL